MLILPFAVRYWKLQANRVTYCIIMGFLLMEFCVRCCSRKVAIWQSLTWRPQTQRSVRMMHRLLLQLQAVCQFIPHRARSHMVVPHYSPYLTENVQDMTRSHYKFLSRRHSQLTWVIQQSQMPRSMLLQVSANVLHRGTYNSFLRSFVLCECYVEYWNWICFDIWV